MYVSKKSLNIQVNRKQCDLTLIICGFHNVVDEHVSPVEHDALWTDEITNPHDVMWERNSVFATTLCDKEFTQCRTLVSLQFWLVQMSFNPLNTKRRPLYLKTQFVPRSKHFSSRL